MALCAGLLTACGGGGGDGPLAGACANGFAPGDVRFSSACTTCGNSENTSAANDGSFRSAASFLTGTSDNLVNTGGSSNLMYTVRQSGQAPFAAGTEYGAVVENVSTGNPQVTLSFVTFRNGTTIDSNSVAAPRTAEAVTFVASGPYDEVRLSVSTQAPDAASEFFLFEFCGG